MEHTRADLHQAVRFVDHEGEVQITHSALLEMLEALCG